MKPSIWPVYVICTLSGLLAANGMYRWAEAQGWFAAVNATLVGVVPPWTIPAAFGALALILGIGVQRVIVWGWVNTPRYGLFAVAPVLVGLAASFTSALFSAGTFTLFSQGNALNFKIRTEATAPFVQGIEQRVDQIGTILRGLENIGAESARLATIEEKHGGGTCQNDPAAGGGCGPRCRFRKRMAVAAAADFESGRRIAADLTTVALDVHRVKSTEVPALYARAVQILRGPDAASLQSSTGTAIDQLSNGFVDDKDASLKIRCDSPDLLARYARLEMAWAKVRAMPNALPAVPDAGLGDSVGENLAGLAWQLGLRADRPAAPYTMAIALLIEIFQICLLLGHMRHLRSLGLDDEAFESYWQPRRRLRPEHVARTRRILERLECCTLSTDRGEFYVVPDTADVLAAEPVVFFGIENRLKPRFRNVDLRALRPDFVASRSEVFGNARFFSLYPLTSVIKRWRRRAMRDLPAAE